MKLKKKRKRLGGSMVYVSKKKINWDLKVNIFTLVEIFK